MVSNVGIGILLRKTRRYWYYMYLNSICKVKEEKLWSHIDRGLLQVSYGSSMKNRRKRRKSRTLDLHGIAHVDVKERLMAFLNFIELPCKVITGDSTKMKAIVRSVVYDYGWSCHEESAKNTGTLIVIDKKEKINNE